MSRARLEATLQAAIAEGLLPAGSTAPATDHRPWPVVLMMGLGAWLSALPLIAAVGLLMGDWVIKGPTPFFLGTLILAAAIVILRSDEMPLFVEQMALPFLVTGLGVLGIGLFEQLKFGLATLVLAPVALATGAAVPRSWLRVLLGATAAALAAAGWADSAKWGWSYDYLGWWAIWHFALLLGLGARAMQQQARDAGRHRTAATAESLTSGWQLATLGGLAWWSSGSHGIATVPAGLQAASLVLACAGVAWAARCWAGLRRPSFLAMLAVPALLAAFMPTLGATLLLLCVLCAAGRWRMAGAAALAAAWIVGSFYQQLHWPLGTKALVLAAAGAVLGALAWLVLRPDAAAAAAAGDGAASAGVPRGARTGIALSACAVLAVANLGIWQKQHLIAHGQPVYVALAPVDPRSLMQGDYMRLTFQLPGALMDGPQDLPGAARAQVVATRDARGVASLRAADGKPLAPGEFLIELTPKAGTWVLVSDAWFFEEGRAGHYARARFGEFRVGGDGRALLVGLRDAQLQPL